MNHVARTTLVAFGLLLGSASLAGAEIITHETQIHDTTTTVEIDLNTTTVLCSAADYGALFLKVGMPELAGLTLLDHQNIGADAPCVAAGACVAGNRPENIIDPTKPTEEVDIRVRAFRQDYIDTTADTCTTSLVERVNVNIRGVEFSHERWADLGSRRVEDCGMTVTGTGNGSGSGSAAGKADGPNPVAEPEVGGCSASSGAGGASLLVLLGALVSLRRRSKRV